MSIVAIDHVQLAYPPGGEAAARAFYGGVLGLTEVPKPERMRARGGMWFTSGGVAIHLGVEDGMRPSLKMHPALVVRGLQDYIEKLAAGGFEWKPDTGIENLARGHTRDPFGNRIELIEES